MMSRAEYISVHWEAKKTRRKKKFEPLFWEYLFSYCFPVDSTPCTAKHLVLQNEPSPSPPNQQEEKKQKNPKKTLIIKILHLKYQHFINVCKGHNLATLQISWIGRDLRLAAKAVLFLVE